MMKTIQTSDFKHYVLPSSISYDAKTNSIAYSISFWNQEKSIRPVQQVYLKALDTSKEVHISANGSNEFSPEFLDDGSLLILSNADNLPYDEYLETRDIRKYFIQNQLYRIKDGSIEKLTNFLHGIDSYVLSASKKKALLTVRYYPEEDPSNQSYRYNKKQIQKILKQLAIQPIIVKDKSFKSDGDLGYKDPVKKCLYLLDLETKELTYLNYQRYMAATFDLEDNIYFYHFNEEGKLAIYRNNELFISCNNVKPNPGSKIVFNTDGTKILLAVQKLENHFNDPIDLICLDNQKALDYSAPFVFDFDNDTEEGVESDGYNFSASSRGLASYCFDGSNQIIFARGIKGNLNLFKASDGQITKLSKDEDNFKGLVLKGNHSILSLHTSSISSTQYVEINTEDGSYQTLTDFNSFIKEKELSQAISFDSNIHGWVMKPINYQKDKKYPTLLVVHGGPNSFYCSGFSLEMQSYASAGFAIIYANPIGSSGYGKKHANMGPAFDDTAMNQLIDYCKAVAEQFDFIDINRIGITGGSYGGFETIYACGHSNFFKTAAALRPLGNFLMIANCSHSAGGENSLEQYPDNYTDYLIDYVKQSPNSYADQIQVPLLIGAHEKDANCIPAQMVQLFRLLKTYHPDLPVKLVLTPDSNHGLNSYGPIHLSLQLREEIIQWFKNYL